MDDAKLRSMIETEEEIALEQQEHQIEERLRHIDEEEDMRMKQQIDHQNYEWWLQTISGIFVTSS